ncbi:heat shock factor protein 1-like isoform X3 [Polyodon spathula]|uniref:heat shock factor protein 1-like isoform X3 n=1 Tax=Polyodon spathula TaxID=7913 RepID=UPI001B7E0774|nr:heat shock factor protein 1-like isoform X3 [Polyodon spathula]XP_041111987.1 heat shock factor protein 1-like isoform X3 [Polyodon spathula]XP_041111989.1 heat shock factor protein 1-like isoform X3 [Polyodon spathula]
MGLAHCGTSSHRKALFHTDYKNGSCFLVSNELRFSKEVLPLYFKHNNMASFVRQLNMYGFHKVVHVDMGLPREQEEVIEFQHPHFRCGETQLLKSIRRKVSISRVEEVKLKQQEMSKILLEVMQVKGRQQVADSKLLAIKQENETLWNEVSSLRQKHHQQHKITRKIIHFIASMVQSKSSSGIKRNLPLMRNSSRIYHSSPKYSHPIRIESDQESSAIQGNLQNSSVYPGGMIISDITQALEHRAAVPWQGDPGCSGSYDVNWRPSELETLLKQETDNLVPSAAPCALAPSDLYHSLLEESGTAGPEEASTEWGEIVDHLAQKHCCLSSSSHVNMELLQDLLAPCPGPSCLETARPWDMVSISVTTRTSGDGAVRGGHPALTAGAGRGGLRRGVLSRGAAPGPPEPQTLPLLQLNMQPGERGETRG